MNSTCLTLRAATTCLLLLLSFNVVSGQQIIHDHRCQVIHTHDPLFEVWLSSHSDKHRVETRSNDIYQIPVVVHVIHNGEPEGEGTNLSRARIESQIRVLNEDFRRKKGTLGYNEHSDGADAKIEFVFAKSSPSGTATDGIVRINRNIVENPPFGGHMVAMGAYFSIWNPNHYLNIWAIPGFQDTGLGLARFPISDLPGLEEEGAFTLPGIDSLHGIPVSDIDGVAINSVHFGESDIDSPYRFGRTGTHEVGHFLGLFHLWGDEGFEGNCDIDDYCEDTPNINSRTSGCPINKLACDGSKAMIENYMDYTDDDCMNIFTQDQVLRMRTVLEHSPRRKSLLTSPGLFPPDVVSIPEDLSQSFQVYPNPVQDKVHIALPPNHRFTDIEIRWMNLMGQEIGTQTNISNPEQHIELKLPNSSDNILLMVIQTDQGVMTRRLVRG